MANRLPFQLPSTLCLLMLSFALSERYIEADEKSHPTSAPRNPTPLYLHGPGFALADLNGDQELDLAEGLCLGRTKDGYFYQVQLRLSGNTSSNVFTIFHNNALGLKITGLDIDADDDIDLIISDRFFRQQIGLWLNDGKGRFVMSLPGIFLPNSDVHAAFVAIDANFAAQHTGVRERRRLPDYLATTKYIQPLLRTSSRLKRHPHERRVHFAVDSLQQRPPPTTFAVS